MSNNAKVPYVSVIKINGKPILPPVITPDLRKELLRCKQQAIKLEQRLKHCRELQKDLQDLLEAQNSNSRPVSQLTFGDNSHIEALNLSDKPKAPRALKNIHLSKDLIEVTQYNANGLKTICSNVKISDSGIDESNQQSSSTASNSEKSKTDRCRSRSESRQESDSSKPTTPPKPRLIRSNSYTLETPSPVLLEHLKKTSCNEFNNVTFKGLVTTRNWTSLENNHTPLETSDFNSINTVIHKEPTDKSDAASSPDKSAEDIDEVKSPTIEVYQTDISVQQITVNTGNTLQNGLCKDARQEAFFSKNPFGVLEPDSELLKVLKDIPDVYANQIIELLKKQHIEQKERLERYDNLNETSNKFSSEGLITKSTGEDKKLPVEEILSSNEHTSPLESHTTSHFQQRSSILNADNENLIDFTSLSDCNLADQPDTNHSRIDSRPNTMESCSGSSNTAPSEKLVRSSTFSMSPSQSLYYSGASSDTDILTTKLPPPITLLDNNIQENIEIGVLREKNGYWEGFMMHESKGNANCSRELFPQIDPITMNALKWDWASSIIGAHIKGYLTRRLIKTEKVQAVIATVKDVLLCAVEVQHSENIDEKDVELHRRLINQLSAALYSFHDIFFEQSTAEQMAIIAADRQRKREKLKRPVSGRNSTRSLNSSRSSRSLNSARSMSKPKLISQSPSLTKV